MSGFGQALQSLKNVARGWISGNLVTQRSVGVIDGNHARAPVDQSITEQIVHPLAASSRYHYSLLRTLRECEQEQAVAYEARVLAPRLIMPC